MATGKQCVRCGVVQPLTNFNKQKDSKDGHHSWCRTCFKSYLLTKRYGLTLEERDAQLEAQHHACALCTEDFDDFRKPVVDHCHDTGFIRGIICSPCNTALGLLRDKPELHRAAAAYLEAPPGLWTGISQD